MKNFLIDFGFKSEEREIEDYREVDLGPKKGSKEKFFWTVLVYIFFSLGIFLRRTVIGLEPSHGVVTAAFRWGVIAASFIIGLAILAPLLRLISKFHKGKLSWEHCLTALSIGFFGDLTFDFLIKNFVGILKA